MVIMLVSIVIPVYNSSKYLEECLDSIINQTYKSLEIICVDDGSTDNSLDILTDYSRSDDRVKVYSKENEGKGAASARNLGLDNATGQYIMFLDSDDVFELDMVSDLVTKITETQAEVVIFGAERFDSSNPQKRLPYLSINLSKAPSLAYFNVNDCAADIYQMSDLIAWNKIFSRKLLLDNDLRFEPIPISDDQYVPSLALVMADRIAVVNKKFVNYRFNTGISQCDRRFMHPEAAYQAVYSIVKRLRSLGKYDLVKRSYINMAVRLMREYFDIMNDFASIQFLHEKYLGEVLEFLDAKGLTTDYFYDPRLGDWYELITTNSIEDIVFKSARAYGSSMTTAILRFQFPYEKVPRGSKIILVGKGMVGRYWYAQLLLSDYAEVVYWAENEADVPSDILFDDVVIAK